jgi:hypothetical protein
VILCENRSPIGVENNRNRALSVTLSLEIEFSKYQTHPQTGTQNQSMSTISLALPLDNQSLQVRQPETNVKCSILLLTTEGQKAWDCIKVCEKINSKYTEEGWVEKYQKLFGADGIVLKENAMEEDIISKYQDPSGYPKRAEYCTLSTITSEDLEKSDITHCAVKIEGLLKVMELQLTHIIPPSEDMIGRVEYTNLLLQFKESEDEP